MGSSENPLIVFHNLSFGQRGEERFNLLHSLILGKLLTTWQVKGIHTADGLGNLTGLLTGLDETFNIHHRLTVGVDQGSAFNVKLLHGAKRDDLQHRPKLNLKHRPVRGTGVFIVEDTRPVLGDDLSYPLPGDIMVFGYFLLGSPFKIFLADHNVTGFKLLGHYTSMQGIDASVLRLHSPYDQRKCKSGLLRTLDKKGAK